MLASCGDNVAASYGGACIVHGQPSFSCDSGTPQDDAREVGTPNLLGDAPDDHRAPLDAVAVDSEYAQAIEDAGIVMAAFGVPGDTAVDCGRLAEQGKVLHALAAVAKPSGDGVSGTVTFHRHENPPTEVEQAAILMTWWATFGERVLLVVPAVIGKPTFETGSDGALRMTILSTVASARLTRVFSIAEAKKLKVESLLDPVRQSVLKEGVGLVVGPTDRQRGQIRKPRR
jgi:hypothetical protein